jgi:hypothetical protein
MEISLGIRFCMGLPILLGENRMAEKQEHDGKQLSSAKHRHEFAVHDGIVILEPFS